MIGNNQNFFLTFKKFQNSIKKLILKLVPHAAASIIFIYPIRIFIIIFNFKISFLKNRIINPVGVTTKKKTIPITIGEIIGPKIFQI